MPKVTVTVPHTFSPAEAAEKIKPAIEKTATDFQGRDTQIDWQGTDATFTFKSMAFTIKGTVAVTDKDATVEVDLPFAAMMFREKAEKAISKNLSRSLADAT